MSDIVAGPVLAADISGGAAGFLVVVLLCLAAAGLFAAMSKSLRRMRANVARGEFGARPEPSVPPGPPAGRGRESAPGPAAPDGPIPPQR